MLHATLHEPECPTLANLGEDLLATTPYQRRPRQPRLRSLPFIPSFFSGRFRSLSANKPRFQTPA
jgi:hypothetical protein